MLTTDDHRRDRAGLRYVYPVVSRRAGGVSVGINLNVNNACNWACLYCQVENLARGGPPPLDLDCLSAELTEFLDGLLNGDFMQSHVPPEARTLMDVAFSGNGEPTSAPEFSHAIDRVITVLDHFELDCLANGVGRSGSRWIGPSWPISGKLMVFQRPGKRLHDTLRYVHRLRQPGFRHAGFRWMAFRRQPQPGKSTVNCSGHWPASCRESIFTAWPAPRCNPMLFGLADCRRRR